MTDAAAVAAFGEAFEGGAGPTGSAALAGWPSLSSGMLLNEGAAY